MFISDFIPVDFGRSLSLFFVVGWGQTCNSWYGGQYSSHHRSSSLTKNFLEDVLLSSLPSPPLKILLYFYQIQPPYGCLILSPHLVGPSWHI